MPNRADALHGETCLVPRNLDVAITYHAHSEVVNWPKARGTGPVRTSTKPRVAESEKQVFEGKARSCVFSEAVAATKALWPRACVAWSVGLHDANRHRLQEHPGILWAAGPP